MRSAATDVAHPAFDPPPILPWNDFRIDEITDKALAVKLIAEILQDDEWHHREDIIEEVEYELELPRKAVLSLLNSFRAHGDIRADHTAPEWLRLTTRWRGYVANQKAEQVPVAAHG